MNTRLIAELVKLRYKLMWANTRTRNGKIVLFFAGYLLLVFFLVIMGMGGIGAGIVAVRSGKAHAVAAGVLGGLYVQALFATVLMGFGMSAVFADSELRRYPILARERRIARHFIGLADPFWILVGALELGLVLGLYVVGPGSLGLGVVAVLLLFVSNYLLAQVVSLLVERLVSRKGGSAILLAGVMALAMLPAMIAPNLKKSKHLFAPLLQVLHYTPPYGAASAMIGSGVDAFGGLGVIAMWLLVLAAILVVLEKRPPRVRVSGSAKLSWDGPFERIGALFGPSYAPLVAQWLRFYSRNNRFRFAYPMAVPIAIVLAVTQAPTAGKDSQFACVLGCFALAGFMGTAQFAVNQFGYLGGGFRRYLLLPTDPAAVLRSGSYTFLLLSAALLPLGVVALKIFSPIPLDWRGFAMIVGVAVAAMFAMQGLALWASVLGPRRGNFQSTFGNDLSLVANIVFVGGVLLLMAVPRILAKVWPAAVSPANWWIVLLLAPLAAAFYVVSLRQAETAFRLRRERILGVMEGRTS